MFLEALRLFVYIINTCVWSEYSNKQTAIELQAGDHLELPPERLEDNKIVYFYLRNILKLIYLIFDNIICMLLCMTDLLGLLLSTILVLLIELIESALVH